MSETTIETSTERRIERLFDGLPEAPDSSDPDPGSDASDDRDDNGIEQLLGDLSSADLDDRPSGGFSIPDGGVSEAFEVDEIAFEARRLRDSPDSLEPTREGVYVSTGESDAGAVLERYRDGTLRSDPTPTQGVSNGLELGAIPADPSDADR